MYRNASKPRENWLDLVKADGLGYAMDGGRAYWHEEHYYELSLAEVTALEQASEEMHQLVIAACQKIVNDKDLLAACDIPVIAQPLLQESLERNLDDEEPTVYGRFDFAYTVDGELKLLEYNADTPAGLIEAAVCQWNWVEQVMPGVDQANTIHERLVKAWREYTPYLGGRDVWFVCGASGYQEDLATVCYLRDTANEAGLQTDGLYIEDIGWDSERGCFLDLEASEITACFKMWPWRWMLSEEYGSHILTRKARTIWLEPMWKAVAQSKVILPVLWEMNEGHPNLVPAYLDGPHGMTRYAVKPVAGWEGAGIVLVDGEQVTQEPPGHTRNQPTIWQSFIDIGTYDGVFPVIGSWMVDSACAGFGFRESDGLITNFDSRFVPHVIDAPQATPAEVAQYLSYPPPPATT